MALARAQAQAKQARLSKASSGGRSTSGYGVPGAPGASGPTVSGGGSGSTSPSRGSKNAAVASKGSESIRGSTLEQALSRVDHMIDVGQRMQQSAGQAWKGGLTDALSGLGGGHGDSDIDMELLSEICTGLGAVKRLVCEADEVQKMLETQTTASRDVATQAVKDLEELKKSVERDKAESSGPARARVAELEKELEDTHMRMAERVVALRGELNEAKARADRAETEAATLATERDALRASAETERRRADEEHELVASWSAKYSALEAEYRDLEPRYTAAMDSQRGRIRLLETQLKQQSARPVLDHSDKLAMLSHELQAMGKQVAGLTSECEALRADAAEYTDAKAAWDAERAKLTADVKEAQMQLWLQEQKLSEFERGLVEAIGQRKLLEDEVSALQTERDDAKAAALTGTATMAEKNALADRINSLKTLVERLAEVCDMTSKRVVKPDGVDQGFGMEVSLHPAGVVISEVRPGGAAEAAGITPGDFLAAVNGVWVVGADVGAVLGAIAECESTLDLIIAPESLVSEALVGDDEDDHEEEGGTAADGDGGDDDDDGARSGDGVTSKGNTTHAPFAVLLSADTVRKGMKVVVESTLVLPPDPSDGLESSTEISHYESAVLHDGAAGTVTEVDVDDAACLVDFGGVAAWLPVGALAYVPPGKTWVGWEGSARGAVATALASALANTSMDAESDDDAPGTLEPGLVEKIARATSTSPQRQAGGAPVGARGDGSADSSARVQHVQHVSPMPGPLTPLRGVPNKNHSIN